MRHNQSEPWMQTASGKAFRLIRPQMEDVDIKDIAHHLSLICRFGGAVRYFYSVAEHSVLIARALREAGAIDLLCLYGLLHDASEAYAGDMIWPLKQLLPEYKDIEEVIQNTIYLRFGMPIYPPQIIKDYDERMLNHERDFLMAEPPHPWQHDDLAYLPGVVINGWSPRVAQNMFLDEFEKLTKRMP